MCLLNLGCRGIRNCKWNPQIVSGIRKLKADCANCERNPQIGSGIRKNLQNPLTFTEFAHICGIRNNYLYSLVAESATKLICRQNLHYRYLYAEFTQILLVESTYILEHV